jgi:hypothetical protein
MNKNTMAKLFRTAKSAISQHSPEILMGVGIAGMITTTVLAVKATPKALQLMEAKKQEEQKEELTPIETVKATWKCYIPTVVTGAASITCLIGSASVSARRTAALAAAYQIADSTLNDYKEKIKEVVGERKAEEVQAKVSEKKAKEQPVSENNLIVTGNGKTLCMDYFSGQQFESDIDSIKRTINEVNAGMLRDTFGYVSLNDVYDELGLRHTEVGDELGWNIIDGTIKVEFSSILIDDRQPCIVMHFERAPKYDFTSCYG